MDTSNLPIVTPLDLSANKYIVYEKSSTNRLVDAIIQIVVYVIVIYVFYYFFGPEQNKSTNTQEFKIMYPLDRIAYVPNNQQRTTIDSLRRAKNPSYTNRILDAHRFLLISGPSGSGKTAFVDELLHATGFYYQIHCGTVGMTSMWQGKTTKNIVNIFENAVTHSEQTNAPTVLFFDECHSLFHGHNYDSAFSVTPGNIHTTFISEIAKIKRDKSKVIVIMATNSPEKLPDDIINRATTPIKCTLPTSWTLSNMLNQQLTKLKRDYRGSITCDIETKILNEKIIKPANGMQRASSRKKVYTMHDINKTPPKSNITGRTIQNAVAQIKTDIVKYKSSGRMFVLHQHTLLRYITAATTNA